MYASRALVDKSCLLVDDDDTNLQSIAVFLEQAGLRLVGTRNGLAGWQEYQKAGHFDFVIVDILMPVLDGSKLIELIRQHEANNHPAKPATIIAISGDVVALQKATSLATLKLEKPFQGSRLLAEMSQLVRDKEGSPEKEVVLIVDDDLFSAQIVQRMLSMYDCLCAPSIATGMTLYVENRKHIKAVLLDATLPDGTGVEFVEQLRK